MSVPLGGAPFPTPHPPDPFGPGAGRLADPPAVARYRAALALDDVHEFPLTPLDTTGIPVWTAATWIDGDFVSGIGYGETDDRARIGAWGELAEGVMVARLAHRSGPTRRASYRELTEVGEAAVDPLRLRLPVGTDYTPDLERLWVQASRVAPGTDADGQPVWLLLEEAAAHYGDLPDGYRPLYPPITNGLGAGDTRARALSHGLLELVQRDASSVGYRAFDRGVVVDLGGVADPATRAILDRLQDGGITVQVKLAETPLGIPVLYAQGRERDLDAVPHPLVLTGAGEGAHPDRERALRKALLEYGASRVRKRFAHGPLADLEGRVPDAYLARVREHGVAPEEGRSTDAVVEWAGLGAREQLRRLEGTWFREAERVPFESVPTTDLGDDPAALVDDVGRRAAGAGLDVFAVTLSPPDAGVTVVKAIVPGLEVETVTYHRIGPRNLGRLRDRIAAGDPLVHPDLVGLGRPPAEAQPVPLAPEDEATLGGPAWIHLDLLEEALGPLYAMYREPAEHVVGLIHERARQER